MLKAALTFGFFGCLRVSEYTLTNRGRFDPTLHPTKNDITWVKDGLHFFIKKSKTDQVRRGTTIAVGHTYRASCPVVALQAYFEDCKAPPGSSLFHFQTGCPLTSQAMRAILRDLLLRCGYGTSNYNTHSLQIGAATAAARAGLPSSTIQQLGRWSSIAYMASNDTAFGHCNCSIITMTLSHIHTQLVSPFVLLPGTNQP